MVRRAPGRPPGVGDQIIQEPELTVTASPDGREDSPGQYQPGAVRRLADDYLREAVKLDPVLGTSLGLPHDRGGLPDYSPDGIAAEAALGRRTLARLDHLI